MTRLPSLDAYNEAVQNPQIAFSDRQLRGGKVRTNGLGLPLALGGGFAITYSIQAGGRMYAVRVFHKQAAGLEARYGLVSSELSRSPSPYFVTFDYQPKGVLVQGAQYPIVKMEWATGDTLGSFLESRYSDRTAMESLRAAFRTLGNHLRGRGIAHGDLQNGNVMVDNGRLRLIDYDGMFVPGMARGSGTEIGHRHFQHPGRAAGDFGLTMDRFSFIAIDLTLSALIERPGLFLKYGTTGENILFTGNDFKDPTVSRAFAELRAIQTLRKSCDDFASVCRAPIGTVPDLEDFLAGRNIPTAPVVIKTVSGAGRPAYGGSLPVVDATHFPSAFGYVGDRVEVVGQITDVKIDLTRGHRPYVFINFGNWRGRIIKVTIWEDGLAKLRQQPDPSWVGRWVSVTGLMDPPYTSQKYHYTHLSVTVEEASQLHLIDEGEAQYRLGRTARLSVSAVLAGRSNREVLQTIRPPAGEPASAQGARGRQHASGASPGRGRVSPVLSSPRSSNQRILQQINATASPAQVGAGGQRVPSGPVTTSGAPQKRGSGLGWAVVVVVMMVVLFLLAQL